MNRYAICMIKVCCFFSSLFQKKVCHYINSWHINQAFELTMRLLSGKISNFSSFFFFCSIILIPFQHASVWMLRYKYIDKFNQQNLQTKFIYVQYLLGGSCLNTLMNSQSIDCVNIFSDVLFIKISIEVRRAHLSLLQSKFLKSELLDNIFLLEQNVSRQSQSS